MPLAVKPEIVGVPVEAVHINVVPLTAEVKFTNDVLVPEHILCDKGLLVTVAVGFTIIVKVFVGPEQDVPPFAKLGVTIIVAVIGAVVKFTAIKAPILPEPLADKPILGVLFVQVYVVVPPVFEVVKFIAAVFAALQTT